MNYSHNRQSAARNGERYMLPNRIRTLLNALQNEYVNLGEAGTGDFEYQDGKMLFKDLSGVEWKHFDSENDMWGGRYVYKWFRQTVTVPEKFAGSDIWYAVRPYENKPVNEEWYWAQPQIEFFVNGRFVCGLDHKHRETLLVKNARGGETLEIHMKVLSDGYYYKGRMRMRAVLRAVNPELYELYRDIVVPLEASRFMETDSFSRIKIVETLNHAMSMIAFCDEPRSLMFLESMRAASAYLREELYGASAEEKPILHCVGHTHIDTAWLWTFEQTRNKAARSFATALELMRRNPEYVFMSSQPQLYEFVKQDEPEIYEAIRKRVREGRWEPEGGMWIEPDCNIPSGESFIRQFLFGKRFFKDEFGADSKILWLPDTFGFSGALPQICKRSGIDYFFTHKLSWNEFDRMPYDTFMWRGIDGTSILAYMGGTSEASQDETEFRTTYNADTDPDHMLGAWKRYQQKDLNRELLYCYGWGDGGGGPTQEMIDNIKRYRDGIPGCPDAEFSHAGETFENLEKQVGGNPHLPYWDGELYFESHRGVLTSNGRIKKYNRKCEFLLHDAENLSAMTGIMGEGLGAYPQERINDCWKRVLINQFHDVLAGVAIPAVWEETDAYYESVLKIGGEMVDAALDGISSHIQAETDTLCVFNTLSHTRDTLVFFDGDGINSVHDGNGKEAACQKTCDGHLVFFAKGLPPKGYASYALSEKKVLGANTISADTHGISTPYFDVRFDDKMHITSLYCKKLGRETVPTGEVLGRILAFEDIWHAWDIRAYYTEKVEVIDNLQSVELVESGPVRVVLRVVRPFRDSVIEYDIIAYADMDRLDFEMRLDWHEKKLLLKADFPVAVNATAATYDIQFGHIQRPIHKNTLWDWARFEVCGHKWGDLSDNSFGLSVLNDCKYGYSAEHGAIRLSLLRCPVEPDPALDKGTHEFKFSLAPHAGGPVTAGINEKAYDFNVPVRTRRLGKQAGKLPPRFSLVSTDQPNIVIETVKKAEGGNGLIIRLYESGNMQTDCEMTLSFPFECVYECDMMENVEKELPHDKQSVKLGFRPFEVKTVKIVLCNISR